MANHKSAKKRSLQSKVKNAVNTQYLTKIRTNLNKLNNSLQNSNSEEATKSLGNVNSIMAKAVKDLCKQENVSLLEIAYIGDDINCLDFCSK